MDLMPVFLSQNAVIILLGVLSLVSTLLFLREVYLRRKITSQADKIIEDSRKKGLQILHQAIQKSQTIVGLAESEGVKAVAEHKLALDKVLQQYQEAIKNSISQSQKVITDTSTTLTQSLTASQKQYDQFLQDIKSRTDTAEFTSTEAARQKINQLFEKFEEKLSQFLFEAEQRSTTSIELELRSVRQLIDTYKYEQMKLIDENIIAMLERTLSLVLSKKLDLKDHMDLVYEALEKAKTEKFIA